MTEPMGERGRQGATPLGHTPGPWHRYTNTLYGHDGYVQGPQGQHVAYVRDDPRDDAVVDGQREGNIALVIAAPDLLAAAEQVLALNDHVNDMEHARTILRAAIAKARGEQ